MISYVEESENDNSGMRKELNGLRFIMDATNVSAIIVHHSGKSSSSNSSSIRGASAIRDWADNVIGLSKKPSPEDGNEYLTLKSEKSRNSVSFKPFRIQFTGLRFERTAMVGDDRSETVVTALKALGGQAKTQTELADKIKELTGLSAGSAKREIKKSVKGGLIQEVTDGRSKGYMIPDHDAAQIGVES